jgi:ATP-dependent exoDNAse (exonuclease V) alpha subunit
MPKKWGKIKNKTYRFEAVIKGEFPERNFPNEPVLELKENAKVMFISNDKGFPRRYFNGKIGEVSRIEDDRIYVRCEDDLMKLQLFMSPGPISGIL